jgi:type IV pilus assembly protein PilN
MKISINLATRPFADIGPMIKRLRIGMAVLAVAAIGLGFGLHALHHKAEAARAREHSLDGAIAHIDAERQGYESMMRQPDNATVLTQAQNLNRLFDEKSFSWTLAMEDLETVLPGGVQVTTLEPLRDEKTGQITLRLRVVGPRDRAVSLVQNLEHSRHFLAPRIVGESAESNGTPNAALEPVSASSRVTFEVLADYNAAALRERDQDEKATEGAHEARKMQPKHAAGAGSTRSASPGLRRPPYSGTSNRPAHKSVPKPRPGVPTGAPQ